LRKKGWRVPDHLYPPEIYPGTEDWISAFWELGADRQIGFGIGPIPSASIDRHTSGWPVDEAAMFRRAIRAMDVVYLKSQSNEPDIPETDNAARDAFRAAMR
jgi:hypothetical protein